MTESAEHCEDQGDGVGQAAATACFSNPLMSDVESDWSPIHDAAYNGRFLSLHRLINQGTSVNLATVDRVTPLHGASQQGHIMCVKLLIQQGADLNSPTVSLSTPLSEACARGHLACVNLLLQHGASPKGGAHPNSPSPIHLAAANGHTECIDSLLQYGTDINQDSPLTGSPLHTACVNQQLHTVSKLLQLGACVNSSRNGASLLHVAAQLSNPELVRVLLEHGADHTLRNAEGKRALDLAAPNSTVQMLLSQRGGVAPLMQLCRLFIRRELGWEGLKEIHSLPIPSELKHYLLYE